MESGKGVRMKYWLLKTEPSTFSIQDLAAAPAQTTCWEGVRNYQARNFIRDDMSVGDRVILYHSNADPSAIVGTAFVIRAAYPDSSAFDPKDPHFDPKSQPDHPTWFMVDIQLGSVFVEPLSLNALRPIASLKNMELLRKGSRLSVQPVRKSEFEAILKLASRRPSAT
jgi:predicted RNA-binding protein with PUA-like domain